MSEIKDGGPAFPASKKTGMGSYDSGVFRAEFEDSGGMSLRDYFAGQALQGMLAHSTRYKPRQCDCVPNQPVNWHQAIASEAYDLADAMLAEREKGGAS